MNYSTSFLDLCSCALGGLLLLMFLMVPQSKPKAASLIKPSLMVESHYPVYTADYNTQIGILPFSVKSIESIKVILSNGEQRFEFNETLSKPLDDLQSGIFNKKLDDWIALEIIHKPATASSPGGLTVYVNIDLLEEDFRQIEVGVDLKLGCNLTFNINNSADNSAEQSNDGLPYTVFKNTLYRYEKKDENNEDLPALEKSDFYSGASVFQQADCRSEKKEGLEYTDKGYKFTLPESLEGSSSILDELKLTIDPKNIEKDFKMDTVCYISLQKTDDEIKFGTFQFAYPLGSLISQKSKLFEPPKPVQPVQPVQPESKPDSIPAPPPRSEPPPPKPSKKESGGGVVWYKPWTWF